MLVCTGGVWRGATCVPYIMFFLLHSGAFYFTYPDGRVFLGFLVLSGVGWEYMYYCSHWSSWQLISWVSEQKRLSHRSFTCDKCLFHGSHLHGQGTCYSLAQTPFP